jgi:hypothetical protein
MSKLEGKIALIIDNIACTKRNRFRFFKTGLLLAAPMTHCR